MKKKSKKQTTPGKPLILNLRLLSLFLILYSCPIFGQQYRNDTLRLFFPNDRTELSEVAVHRLDSLLPMILRNKKALLSLEGYADYTGKDDHNVMLSEQRAKVVKKYLVSKGIDSLRLAGCTGKGAVVHESAAAGKGNPVDRKAELVIRWPVAKPKSPAKPAEPASAKENKPKIEDLKPGKKMVLPNVNFYGGRHTLLESAYPTLAILAATLKVHPELKIEIRGHICCDHTSPDGFDADNNTNTLSLNRAREVYEKLIGYGIDSTRMTYKGFGGKQRLIQDERSETDQMLNRRVEVRVLSN